MDDSWFLWWVFISLTLWWLRRPIVCLVGLCIFLAVVERLPPRRRRVRRGVVSH